MDELFREIVRWVQATYPGLAAVEVAIKLSDGRKARFPVPAIAPRLTSPVFVPNGVQQTILEALDGTALRSPALKQLPGLEGRVFKKPGGIQELQERGLVNWDRSIGYYRPDAPPEGEHEED